MKPRTFLLLFSRDLWLGLIFAALSVSIALRSEGQTKFMGGGGSGGPPGSGTVTSVAATVPSFMAVTGSPITTTGTLAFSFATQAQGTIFAAPCSGAGAVTFRLLCAADIPALAPSKITGTAVVDSDARLTNARTPTAHASTHGSAGSDAVTIAPSQVTGTAVVTADSRLSDARTPLAHASTHAAAGADPVTITEAQVTGLVTDLAGKQPTGSYVTALTGDVVATGPGSVAATIQANSVALGTDTTGGYAGSSTEGGAAIAAITTDALESATATVNVSSAAAPSSGQVLTATSETAATWQTPSTNAATADALSANGTNCSAPNFARGVDASGNCEGAAIVASDLPNTTVTPGAYTSADITVDAQGRITAAASGSGASPGGADTQVQYNDSSAFGGDAQFTFNETSGLVTLTGATNDGSALANFNPGSGTSFVRVNNNGSIVVNGDGGTATNPFDVQSGGSTRFRVAFNGTTTIAGSGSSLAIGTVSATTAGGKIEGHGLGFVKPSVKTADYTTASTDFLVRLDPSSAGFTLTLSSANAGGQAVPNAHQVLVLKNVTSSTNTITVTPSSGTIDGAASITITTAYGVARVFFDGTNWFTW